MKILCICIKRLCVVLEYGNTEQQKQFDKSTVNCYNRILYYFVKFVRFVSFWKDFLPYSTKKN